MILMRHCQERTSRLAMSWIVALLLIAVPGKLFAADSDSSYFRDASFALAVSGLEVRMETGERLLEELAPDIRTVLQGGPRELGERMTALVLTAGRIHGRTGTAIAVFSADGSMISAAEATRTGIWSIEQGDPRLAGLMPVDAMGGGLPGNAGVLVRRFATGKGETAFLGFHRQIANGAGGNATLSLLLPLSDLEAAMRPLQRAGQSLFLYSDRGDLLATSSPSLAWTFASVRDIEGVARQESISLCQGFDCPDQGESGFANLRLFSLRTGLAVPRDGGFVPALWFLPAFLLFAAILAVLVMRKRFPAPGWLCSGWLFRYCCRSGNPELVLKNVMHEVNTPLNGIIGSSEYLVRYNARNLTREQKYFLAQIAGEGRALATMLESWIDLFALHLGCREQRDSLYDPVETALDVVESCRPQAEDRDIRIELDFRLPGNFCLSGDAPGWKMMIRNLLLNAVRYTGDGGKIRVSLFEDRKGICLTVEDSGAGFSANRLRTAFKPLLRMSQDPMVCRGRTSGVGLAMVQALAHRQGGAVEAGNRRGAGALVRVRIPASRRRAGTAGRRVPDNHPRPYFSRPAWFRAAERPAAELRSSRSLEKTGKQ